MTEQEAMQEIAAYVAAGNMPEWVSPTAKNNLMIDAKCSKFAPDTASLIGWGLLLHLQSHPSILGITFRSGGSGFIKWVDGATIWQQDWVDNKVIPALWQAYKAVNEIEVQP